MAKNQENQKAWDRVYRDVKESTDRGDLPDPDEYQNLTTPSGSKK